MTLLSILKIQTKIFINNLTKINFVLKIIYFFAFVFILFNYNQTGRFLIEYIKNHFHRNDVHFYEIANLLLFVIFLLNLVSVFFVGTGKTLSKQLKFFPIPLNKIVLYEIIIGVFDISNLMFVGIYFSAYFIFYDTFLMLSILEFLSIFILFVLLVSNVSFFIKNIVSNYFVLHRKRKVIQIISVILLFICVQYLQTLNIHHFNIVKLSTILNYFPSGKFLLFGFNSQPSSLFFLETLIYFLFFNLMFLVLNVSLTKKLLKINYAGTAKSNKVKTKFSVSHYVKNSNFDPLIKKEILYNFRSIKMIFTFIVIFFAYLLLLYSVIFQTNSRDIKELLLLQTLGILFQLLPIMAFTGNLFRFGGLDLKSYFIFPISPIDLISSKVIITYLWLVINFISVTIGLFYLEITLFNYLFFIALLLITFYLFHYFAILLSIYFPKKVDMNSLNGLNISFVTLLIFVPILAISFLLLQYALGFTELLPKIIIILFSLSLPLFLSKLQITNHLSVLLIKRKSSIIEAIS